MRQYKLVRIDEREEVGEGYVSEFPHAQNLIKIPLPPLKRNAYYSISVDCNMAITLTRVLLLRMSSRPPIHLAGSTTTAASFCCCSSITNADDHTVSRKVIQRKGVLTLPNNASMPASDQPFSELLPIINIGRLMHSLQWNIQPQMLIEKAIIDCRFFTLFGVVGSLVGSVLCFLEGCFLVIQSYVQYFHILSERLDQGHVVQLLIEAIDMFLVGTAMVMFGVGLYVMFVGSKNYDKEEKDQTRRCAGSNLLGLFSMKGSPRWVGMESIAQAKSKIGHAVMMILQVGILDKFKDIPIVTGFDLACFAAAVLTSSACIFLLSRLHR